MKREDFKKIIRLRSVRKINAKRGNYDYKPGYKTIAEYVKELVESQMKLDGLLIRENGDLCIGSKTKWNEETGYFEDYRLYPGYGDDEICTFDDMEKRIKKLISEIVGSPV